jgi:hypothetical protein
MNTKELFDKVDSISKHNLHKSRLSQLERCPKILKEPHYQTIHIENDILYLSFSNKEEKQRAEQFTLSGENRYPYLCTANSSLASSSNFIIKSPGILFSGMSFSPIGYAFLLENNSSICLENISITIPEVICSIKTYSINLSFIVKASKTSDSTLSALERLLSSSLLKWKS